MLENLQDGMQATKEEIVTVDKTACVMKSGSLDVYATPALVALGEKAACAVLANHLGEGFTSVGIKIDMSHLAATPLGMKVRCTAVVSQIDGRKISFYIEAYDECGKIGEGTHERFVVDAATFMEKTNKKLNS